MGVYHPKWEERPILLIEPHTGETVTPDTVRVFLANRVVKWRLPDAILIAPIPLTATGKIDKNVIRDRYRNCLVEGLEQIG